MMRVGRIEYINCFPVYGAVDRGIVKSSDDLVTGTPADLNNLLAAGQLDVSVISAVEYARNAKQYYLLSDLAISCDGPVRSVILYSRHEARDLDGATVLVSSSSRTSVHLLELLCHERWSVSPRFVEARAEPQDLEMMAGLPHDAVLVIGDAALLLSDRGSYQYAYDLGHEWKQWTELPFVFAVWAARRDADKSDVEEVHQWLLKSRDWGLAHLDLLADDAARATGIDTAACRTYLSGMDYALSYRHLEGLTSFFRRLVEHGAVSEGTLSFLTVA